MLGKLTNPDSSLQHQKSTRSSLNYRHWRTLSRTCTIRIMTNSSSHSVCVMLPRHYHAVEHVCNVATLEQTKFLPSRLLSPHTRFYVREMRILAYSQLLESYRSLTLDSLARSFGVSVDFVDRYVCLSHSMIANPFPRSQRAVTIHRIRPPPLYDRQSTWSRRDKSATTQKCAIRNGDPAGRYLA